MDEYATHLEPLLASVLGTPGDVLELGVGYYSQSILGPACRHQKKKLVSCDNNEQWLTLCGGGVYCPDWWLPESVMGVRWGVVFVDSAPASSRLRLIEVLLDRAVVFVLHDANPCYNQLYRYADVLPHFAHQVVWDKRHPATIIASKESLSDVRALL